MKKIILFILIAVFACTSFAEKVATLPELMRPTRIMVDEDHLFVVEFPHILIYSLTDYKPIKKIGKRGEGPKEFLGRLNLLPYSDHIIINSLGKITYWTKMGEFIKEVKCPFAAGVEPCEDTFVSLGFRQRNDKDPFNYRTIDVYDQNFKKLREIDRKKAEFQGNRGMMFYTQPYYFYVMKNKYIIVTGHEGFVLNVFNKNGEKLYTIKRDYEKIKVTDVHKLEVHDFLKNHPRFKAFYEANKHLIKFADNFPAIQGFQSFGDQLYVYTYHKKGGNIQTFIYDENGNLFKEVYLPIVKKDIQSNFPFTIDKDKIYRLLENEDTEEWELYIDDIK